MRIPTSVADLTPAWLTSALRTTGVIGSATVVAADVEAIGAGAGFLGDIVRIAPRYSAPEPGAPATLIAKLPSNDPQRSAMSNLARFSEREVRFYEQVAGDCPVRTPRCYVSAMDVERHRYVLLLEDMAPARVGDQVAGCSVDDAELAVRAIAPLHAAWWGSERLEALDWMPPLAAVHPSVEQWWQAMWQRVAERSGASLPAELHRIGEQFGRRAMYALQQLDPAPRTLVHADYRLDNLFFGNEAGGTPTIAVGDWQLAARGRGVYDVAFFLSSSLDRADRKQHEMRLLRLWHDALIDGGVRGYTFDDALRDYRLATFYCLTSIMLVLTMMDEANPRSIALYDTWLRRIAAAVEDLDVGELLPG
jgi:hypothetical protein